MANAGTTGVTETSAGVVSPDRVSVIPVVDMDVTTNGQLLARKADRIVAAGLRRINVSLDTLDAAAFRAIARSGDLATVRSGIGRMLDACALCWTCPARKPWPGSARCSPAPWRTSNGPASTAKRR